LSGKKICRLQNGVLVIVKIWFLIGSFALEILTFLANQHLLKTMASLELRRKGQKICIDFSYEVSV